MKRRTLISLMAAAPVSSVLSACGGGIAGGVSLRLLNASAAYPSLDLFVDDEREVSAVAYGNVSGYADVPDGGVTTTLTRTDSFTSLLAQSRTLDSDTEYTVVAYGWEGALKSVVLAEDRDDADSGKCDFSVWNLGADAGPVDVYLTAQDDPLESATPNASAVSGDEPSEFVSINAGTYRLRVTGADDKTDLRLDASGLVLASKKSATLVVTAAAGGVLVNAMLVPQGAAVTTFLNALARVRVVAATTDNGTVIASIDGVQLGATIRASTIGEYTLLPANSTAALAVSVNGVARPTSTLALAAGSDTTVLVYGDAAAPLVSVLNDDNRLPTDATKYKIRLVHALANLGANLSLTVSFTRVASEVVYGSSSTFSNQTPNTEADLSVSSPLSATPVYTALDLPLEANTVYSFFMMGEAGTDTAVGVLLTERSETAETDSTDG
ncbi:MAG TPA: DUF4397 domain-containing protein [Ideonella sp.]|nr:DUF4397 domain-containing protein [Ideonella sp.]